MVLSWCNSGKVISDLTDELVVTFPAGVDQSTGVDFDFLRRSFFTISSVTIEPAPPLSSRALIRLYLVLPNLVLNWAKVMGLRCPVLGLLIDLRPRMIDCIE